MPEKSPPPAKPRAKRPWWLRILRGTLWTILVLAVTMCLGLILGGPHASALRRQWGAAAVGAYLLLAVANFAWLLPVLSAETIPYADWARRMWWKSWI